MCPLKSASAVYLHYTGLKTRGYVFELGWAQIYIDSLCHFILAKEVLFSLVDITFYMILSKQQNHY